ncbi:hypothetical protein EUX98_g5842 [Antrodiella citrinella]|uniref:Uncharacterized protein n=1 Tax=Antrodiella citrinella TaxID=2447956 RepID=A0A4S4MRF8_9APHY|nr:hypothetical protein EUX98_g5842 [Antrodiella citrinella]
MSSPSSRTPLLSSTPTTMISYRLAIPTFVFLFTLGFYTIVVHMYASHAPDRFLEAHKASKVPLTLTNNRIPVVDALFTPLVSFFVAAFGDRSSDAYAITANFVWAFGAAIQLPLIEAQRVPRPAPLSPHRPQSSESSGVRLGTRLLKHPMVWGILYQRFSGGWVLPLWLLAFLHAHPDLQGEPSRVDAESVFVGWWAGHTVPALMMLVPGLLPLDRVPVWIAFPVWMVLAQKAYVLLRGTCWPQPPGSERQGDGYTFVQLTYASALLCSFASHVHLVLIPALTATPSPAPLQDKIPAFLTNMKDFFVPSTGLGIPSVALTTASSGVRHFVQWDTIVVFLALFTGVVWDVRARGSQAGWKTVVWMSMLSVMVGPGVVTAWLMMYREREIYTRRMSTAKRTIQSV